MSEQEIGIEQARGQLGPLAIAAATEGQITYLTSHGHRVAAIVPLGLVTNQPAEQPAARNPRRAEK